MKWTYNRVPDCFHCRHFIGWPYCRFFPDGIPWDIQYGANDRCQQFHAMPTAHIGMLERIRGLLHRPHGSHGPQRYERE